MKNIVDANLNCIHRTVVFLILINLLQLSKD